jgi:hypothetical protein
MRPGATPRRFRRLIEILVVIGGLAAMLVALAYLFSLHRI